MKDSALFMTANYTTMLIGIICLFAISFSGVIILQQLLGASLQSFLKSKDLSSGKDDYHEYHIDKNFAAEMNRVVARMDNLEKQISLLSFKNHDQEKDIDILKMEINRINNKEQQMNTTVKRESSRKQIELSRRKVRSTETSGRRSSFWSKAPISSHELGSMPYDNYRISIYGHSNNAFSTNIEKQFFYFPSLQLLHRSAKADFNNITKQHEVVFSIQMWNEELEDQVRKYTEKIVKHPVDQEKISVLPIEKVKLSNSRSNSYQLKNEWKEYNYGQCLQLALICQRFDQCSRISDEMNSNPQQFRDLRLEFSVSSQKPLHHKKEIVIEFERIVGGAFVSQLMQRYSEADDVFLTAEDEHRLITETKENIIVALEEDTTEIDPTSGENIYAAIKNVLIESRGKITFDHSLEMWSSLFWNEEDYRPDKIAKQLNEIYPKLDKRSMSALSNCLEGDSEVECNFSASFIERIAKASHYSKERVETIFQKSKGNIIWNENEFITKPIVVAKLSIARLYDKKAFPETKTTILYNRAMLYQAV